MVSWSARGRGPNNSGLSLGGMLLSTTELGVPHWKLGLAWQMAGRAATNTSLSTVPCVRQNPSGPVQWAWG